MASTIDTRDLVTALKAAAEPTRLRILLLLREGELNVKDLTQILGQSQPRLSRHLKLLSEAGLVERFREGSWVYFHISDRAEGGRLALRMLEVVDEQDTVLVRDRQRAETLKKDRERVSQDYFQKHAGEWDRIRALHVAESEVETAMREALGEDRLGLLVDLGTGTGRILELFAGQYERGIGLDINQSMLALARGRLAAAGIANAQVRHGDLYDLGLSEGAADAVVMHQVLHFLSEPASAIAEAARILAPGGRLLIVDFAPHDLEFLRNEHAHERLGFSHALMREWLAECGLAARRVRDLAPPSGGAKLTVSLWLAERARSGQISRQSSTSRKLEAAT